MRYAVVLGRKTPGTRRARVEKFARHYQLTDTQREYIDLISREIPYMFMERVFGVEITTKNYHFGELRQRLGVKTRDEMAWLYFNVELEG